MGLLNLGTKHMIQTDIGIEAPVVDTEDHLPVLPRTSSPSSIRSILL